MQFPESMVFVKVAWLFGAIQYKLSHQSPNLKVTLQLVLFFLKRNFYNRQKMRISDIQNF